MNTSLYVYFSLSLSLACSFFRDR